MNMQFPAIVIADPLAIINSQNEEISQLKATIQKMHSNSVFLVHYVNAVNTHNTKCEETCAQGMLCGWEGVLRRTGRRCGECPVRHKVDVMPAKGAA